MAHVDGSLIYNQAIDRRTYRQHTRPSLSTAQVNQRLLACATHLRVREPRSAEDAADVEALVLAGGSLCGGLHRFGWLHCHPTG